MQCTSLFPGCYSTRDVNIGPNGITWSIYNNNDRALKNGNSYNVFFLPHNKSQFLINDKEVLRQTLLKHESIFRDQVCELHRLYRRQRELMDEIRRRQILEENLKLQSYQSNPFLPNTPSESAQKTWNVPNLPTEIPAASRLTPSGAENFQSSSKFSEWKKTQAGHDFGKAEGSLNECKLSPSKCQKSKRKILDLELPAEEYIDSEEDNQFKEGKVSNVLEAPGCQEGSSSASVFLKRTHELADLNEAIWVEDSMPSDFSNFVSSEDNKQKFLANEAEQRRRILDSLPHISTSGKVSMLLKQSKAEPHSEVHINCVPNSSGRVPMEAMDLNMPPCRFLDLGASLHNVGSKDEVHKLEDSQAASSHASIGQNFSLASTLNTHLGGLKEEETKTNQEGLCNTNLADHPVFTSQNQHSIECASVDIIVDSNFSGVGNQLDLNSCICEDEPSTKISLSEALIKTGAETDREAPVSPENMECLPPRGKYKENQVETLIKLSKQDDRDQKDELVRMAAEVIVSISTPGLQKLLVDNPFCETLESSSHNSLYWFAEIIASKASDPENEVGEVLCSNYSKDQQKISSNGTDYFEAIALELNEVKLEEYSCLITNQKEEAESVLSPSQPRRGRTGRFRQSKDFQREVLPSLTCLSRPEVTEDLQTIGGLIEAAGFSVEIGMGRRSAGRCLRSRRRSSNSISHEMKISLGSLLKQKNNDLELKGWGKMNRRQRTKRVSARTCPHLFNK